MGQGRNSMETKKEIRDKGLWVADGWGSKNQGVQNSWNNYIKGVQEKGTKRSDEIKLQQRNKTIEHNQYMLELKTFRNQICHRYHTKHYIKAINSKKMFHELGDGLIEIIQNDLS